MFVDLDGTLIRTDLLHEAALELFTQSPWLLLRVLLKLSHGRAALKKAMSEAITPEVTLLPFRKEVLEFIASQQSLDREIILATATDYAWAYSIADELRVFDSILSSDGARNLKGTTKLDAIQEYCRANGHVRFDYVGDAHADLPIWREAHGIYLVAPSRRLLKKVHEFGAPLGILGTREPLAKTILAALRPQQWAKNLLVFVPLVTSHNIFKLGMPMAAVLAFVCFCLCASAVYILNDLVDIKADRRHPIKRNRPFASASLPITWGLPLASGLLMLAFAVSVIMVPGAFSAVLAVYFFTTCVYSFLAKRIVMLDVLTLAGLYTIRIFAGGAATGIIVSEWLMAFSMFLFVSLAFAKRYAELERLSRANEEEAKGRGYNASDISLIESMGSASGFIAVLVLALYLNSDQMKSLYRNPLLLWLVCPILMYWISRIWIKAKRGELFEDPVVFTLRDRVSLCLGLIVGTLLVAASLI